ncbi:diguanylate cyclase [Aurantimonas sp. A2-1-M11]|uniref:GGDEF domain-containing protein n=1 Tax=Aurantimonas sp. A2-1-M11 TaxID=3113712 RepID=UPI002F920480
MRIVAGSWRDPARAGGPPHPPPRRTGAGGGGPGGGGPARERGAAGGGPGAAGRGAPGPPRAPRQSLGRAVTGRAAPMLRDPSRERMSAPRQRSIIGISGFVTSSGLMLMACKPEQTVPSTEFFLGVVNGLGIFALVTMLYGRALRTAEPGIARGIALGLLFGVGASLSIANAVELAPGLRIDPRAVMLVLAAPFGGPGAATVAAAVTSAYRLYLGGSAALPGIANIVTTAGVGAIFAYCIFENMRPAGTRQLLMLGFFSNVPLLFILTVPVDNAGEIFLRTIGPMIIADVLGVLILGRFLCNERKAFVFGRALEAEATTDPLTLLPNRRHLERRTSEMVETAQRNGKPISVLVIDIDRFKEVNDNYGHDVGDAILQKVAAVVRASVRKSDALARFGGEEVVVAMADTTLAAAAHTAERIRSAVDADVFHRDRETGNVTVSVGVATQQGEDLSFKRLFKAADEALFLAKQRGRNRVEFAVPAKEAADFSTSGCVAAGPAKTSRSSDQTGYQIDLSGLLPPVVAPFVAVGSMPATRSAPTKSSRPARPCRLRRAPGYR